MTNGRTPRQQASIARSTRQLMLGAIHVCPDWGTGREPLVVCFVDDPLGLILSPSLSDFEVRFAAYAAALRLARPGDASFGWTATRLHEVVSLIGTDPESALRRAMVEE